jgi:hypothetical protein
MKKRYLLTLIFLFLSQIQVNGGEFSGEFRDGFIGELILYPEGCQNTESRKCRLGSVLTYKSPRNGLVWQTDEWNGDEFESGTTNGASIPKWAWPIIGKPYDESYLKAAIVHDHYCYKENRVRSWRDTHLMFYDALCDLNVEEKKAKMMFFAVYIFGPHWVKLVPGEDCGPNCIKLIYDRVSKIPIKDQFGVKINFEENEYIMFKEDRLSSEKSQDQIKIFQEKIEKKPDLTIEEIQKYAEQLEPDYIFFKHGDSYTPTRDDDKNIFPQMKK